MDTRRESKIFHIQKLRDRASYTWRLLSQKTSEFRITASNNAEDYLCDIDEEIKALYRDLMRASVDLDEPSKYRVAMKLDHVNLETPLFVSYVNGAYADGSGLVRMIDALNQSDRPIILTGDINVTVYVVNIV